MLKYKALVDDKVLSISTAKVHYTIYFNVAEFLRGIPSIKHSFPSDLHHFVGTIAKLPMREKFFPGRSYRTLESWDKTTRKKYLECK